LEETPLRDYLIKRIVVSIAILWIIASLNFVIFQVVSPVRPEDTILPPGGGRGSQEAMAQARALLRRLYGLDQPIYIRYVKYVENMFTWNFGLSFRTMTPVASEMTWRIENSVLLLGLAETATILIGIPIGIFAASRRGSKIDVATIGGGLLTWGVPTFFIQLLALLLFAYYSYVWFGFSIFPTRGIYSIPPPADPLIYIGDVAWHLALPVATLVIAGFGSWALYTRNILLEALTQDYIVTARAKGLDERTVLYRHAFRATLPPIVTVVALAVPALVTGAMITEYLFNLPGIGQWYLTALMSADYPVVQSVLFIYALLTIFANLFADLMYGVLDPRIRVGAGTGK
jgi:peptide/nickel transport system permease protein